jgi:putative Ca2+/H+ antiporter (TMEM165/GDT1 family)
MFKHIGGAVTAFWISLFFVFIAEMGDKTQMMTLTFSTRYRALTVFAGVGGATLLISLISVGVGEALGSTLPVFWIDLLAGVAFIGFGLWTLWNEDSVGTETEAGERFGPLVTVALAFFLAELGDRTMLATVMIAGRQHNFIGVWLGSTVGLLAANSLAIVVGKLLGKKLPEKIIRYGTALVFIGSGMLAIIEAVKRH